MYIKLLFGKAIKEYRLSKGISQEKLAELSNLHRTYISDIERGNGNVSLEKIEKICKALGVEIYDFFNLIRG